MKQEVIEFTKTIRDEEGKPIGKQEGTVSYNMPEILEEAVQLWGEEVVLSNLLASIRIKIQGIARSAENTEEAQSFVNSYNPSVQRERVGGASKKAIFEALKAMSDEDRKAFLSQLGLV